jgi:hypothetical protein
MFELLNTKSLLIGITLMAGLWFGSINIPKLIGLSSFNTNPIFCASSYPMSNSMFINSTLE